ncbi:MAG: hypothetical protein LH606_15730 [Cytophagaceae bacterium]|nr:hypothetical protein [Cytophagaceae bacterium]
MRTKYWLVGGFSAVLIGSGLSVLSEASMLKHDGAPLSQWFIMGVYGFILTIGGLGIMQISTRIRVILDVRKEMRRTLKKIRKNNQEIRRRADRREPGRRESGKKENPV